MSFGLVVQTVQTMTDNFFVIQEEIGWLQMAGKLYLENLWVQLD